VASRKFEVLRFQPDDDVNVASFISVTFTALSRSTYDYPYVAQPTMPDEFMVPPTRAEEIPVAEGYGAVSVRG